MPRNTPQCNVIRLNDGTAERRKKNVSLLAIDCIVNNKRLHSNAGLTLFLNYQISMMPMTYPSVCMYSIFDLVCLRAKMFASHFIYSNSLDFTN